MNRSFFLDADAEESYYLGIRGPSGGQSSVGSGGSEVVGGSEAIVGTGGIHSSRIRERCGLRKAAANGMGERVYGVSTVVDWRFSTTQLGCGTSGLSPPFCVVITFALHVSAFSQPHTS